VLEFIDPRAGVDAVTAPGDPYGEPVRVGPNPGLLVVFPSWLYHWVHPYAGQSPRIAVSFNATLGAPDTVQTCIRKGMPNSQGQAKRSPGTRHNEGTSEGTPDGSVTNRSVRPPWLPSERLVLVRMYLLVTKRS
jgi:hypothetical protein